jgi:hypothetical protein
MDLELWVGVERKADDLGFYGKEVNPGCNLAQFCMEGFG